MKTFQKVLFAFALLGLLVAAGCKEFNPLVMQRNRIFLMGRLVAGTTCDMRLIWRKAPEDTAPVTVTADLSQIGGPAGQELAATDNGTWRWTGQVLPDVSGERTITITAIDPRNQKKELSKRFPVFNTDKAIAIGAGGYLRLAVKADGTVVAWKNHYALDMGFAPVDVPGDISDVVAVATTPSFASSNPDPNQCLALKADGTVAAWGDKDNYGTVKFPAGLSDVVAIAANAGHCLALKADGTVAAWGSNQYGECKVPAGLTDVIAIAAESERSVALTADGTVVTWGRLWNKAVPRKNITAVAGDGDKGCNYVVDNYGNAFLDSNSPLACHEIPVRAGGGFTALAVVGAGFGLGLRSNGAVVSWVQGIAFPTAYFVNEGPDNVLAIAVVPYDGSFLSLAEAGTLRDWIVNINNGQDENTIPDELK